MRKLLTSTLVAECDSRNLLQELPISTSSTASSAAHAPPTATLEDQAEHLGLEAENAHQPFAVIDMHTENCD